jgi:hypothetical protein
VVGAARPNACNCRPASMTHVPCVAWFVRLNRAIVVVVICHCLVGAVGSIETFFVQASLAEPKCEGKLGGLHVWRLTTRLNQARRECIQEQRQKRGPSAPKANGASTGHVQRQPMLLRTNNMFVAGCDEFLIAISRPYRYETMALLTVRRHTVPQ